MGGNHSN